jgi:hypothetical protein
LLLPLPQDAAKKAEAQVREAATAAQARALDLTRSRAELLAARDQLSALQSQLDACMASSPALFKPNGPLGDVAGLRELMASGDAEYGELTASVGNSSNTAEGVWGAALLARLRAAQGLRKEAEARAEALQRSLAAAEAQQLHATVSGRCHRGWEGREMSPHVCVGRGEGGRCETPEGDSWRLPPAGGWALRCRLYVFTPHLHMAVLVLTQEPVWRDVCCKSRALAHRFC